MAPTFAEVLASGINPKENTVILHLKSTAGNKYEMKIKAELAQEIISNVAFQLVNLLEQSKAPPPELKGFRPSGTKLAERPDGKPALFLSTENGFDLPIDLDDLDLDKLAAQIQKARRRRG